MHEPSVMLSAINERILLAIVQLEGHLVSPEGEHAAIHEEFTVTRETLRATSARVEARGDEMVKASRQILRALGEEEVAEEMTQAVDLRKVNWPERDVGVFLVVLVGSGIFYAGIKAIDYLFEESTSGQAGEVNRASLP